MFNVLFSQPIWQLVFLALAFVLARLLHSLPRLRRLLLPEALTAGLLLAVFYNGSQYLGFSLPKHWLRALVVHVLNIFYIALALKSTSIVPHHSRHRSAQKSAKLGGSDVGGTVLFILWHYGMQAFIGLGYMLLLVRWFYADLPPVLGLFVPLGYALGPAQAYQIGNQWQDASGQNLGDIGLVFGALGYLWASIGGLLALRLFGCGKQEGLQRQNPPKPQNSQNSQTKGPAPGSHTLALAQVFVCYGLALFALDALELGFYWLKQQHQIDLLAFMDTLRSISFVFSALAALGLQWLWRTARRLRLRPSASPELLARWRTSQHHSRQSLNHLSSVFANLMVCAGIGSVSFPLIWSHIGVIANLAVFSAAVLAPLHFLLARRFFHSEKVQRSLTIYGSMMGTTSTGMTLLGVLDPYYESQAARDYLLATGFAFLGLLPVIASLQWLSKGQYAPALALYGTYAILTSLAICWRIQRNRRRDENTP